MCSTAIKHLNVLSNTWPTLCCHPVLFLSIDLVRNCCQVDGERRSYDPNFVETKPPHVYAIADKAYRNMATPATEYSQRSQSIMVSGESGAGKTETCKIIMKVGTTTFKVD